MCSLRSCTRAIWACPRTPAGGYDKWTQAGDIRAVLDKLGIDRADIVAHDIGTMVAYAYAAGYPDIFLAAGKR
jgi:pimeloyl-ACP methyl ester carboxylesterase